MLLSMIDLQSILFNFMIVGSRASSLELKNYFLVLVMERVLCAGSWELVTGVELVVDGRVREEVTGMELVVNGGVWEVVTGV